MISYAALVFSAILSVTWGLQNLRFPPGFQFGVATAAYQVEGGWNVSDKTETIWDRFTHTHPELIADHSTGDVACDSYHNWKRDVEMVEELGVHFYRFSISWSRLLPQGFPTHISEDGRNYYNSLIDALLEKGIEPLVTIYHWELPQRFQDLGGWTNPLISDWFSDYARVVFSLYGDRVKTWITINEAEIFCNLALNIGNMDPGNLDEEVAPYLCIKHVLMAHAKAYRVYDEEFRGKYHGQISIATQILWFDPLTAADEEIAELARLNIARSSYPIFSKEGGWPPALEKIIAENSRKLGYPRSSLPPLTEDEIKLVKGTYDFYALNHYTSRLIRKARPGEKLGAWPLNDCKDLDATTEYHPTWNRTASSWFYVNPKGIRQVLVWLKKEYGDINIFITENGFSSYGGLSDANRINYYKENLEQVLLAIQEDGVNVTGYTAWTLMDNFEWMDGYSIKFGLYEVDFTSPQRTRTPRASARYYSSIVAKHSLDVPVPDIKLEEVQHVKTDLANNALEWNAEDQSFPPWFKFGVASAAYQVEGAWNISDKGESIWDRFTHNTPSPIADQSSGDVACDSYHLWKQDIELVSEVGAQFYRISISWARLLPNGFPDRISEDGKSYYSNLIDGLLEKGIEPVITLYHWDLPQRLQDLGGWTNPLISDWFAAYARVAYSLYGDRVKTWITINEPWIICDVTYMTGTLPPAVVNSVGAYICNKNVLMAHARAWRIYDEEFKPKYHGQVSLANDLIWMEAANENEEETAESVREFLVGRYSHPIFSKEGGWPEVVEKRMAELSLEEGYSRSILPALTKDEIDFMRGTYDFYGVTFHTSRLVRRAKDGEALRPWPAGDVPQFQAKVETSLDWPSPLKNFAVHPEGIRKQLSWLKKQYGDIPFLITGNGLATHSGTEDVERVEYMEGHLKQVLLAIKDDKVNVTAYTAWSLLDNFDWTEGYNNKFGLYEVEFTSPQRTRTARASAKYYASVAKTRSLDVSHNFTTHAATKSSKSDKTETVQDSNTCYIFFGVIALIVVVITTIVTWRMKSKSKLEKNGRYTVVNGTQDDNQIGTNAMHNSAQNCTQNVTRHETNGTHNGAQNGAQNGTRHETNGTHNSAQNGAQNGTQHETNGTHNGAQNGAQNGTQNGTRHETNGTHNSAQSGTQNGSNINTPNGTNGNANGTYSVDETKVLFST